MIQFLTSPTCHCPFFTHFSLIHLCFDLNEKNKKEYMRHFKISLLTEQLLQATFLTETYEDPAVLIYNTVHCIWFSLLIRKNWWF